MTAMVDERTTSRDIRLLAARMAATQEGEIEQLENWLAVRNETVRDPADDEHAHASTAGMRGMLTEEEESTCAVMAAQFRSDPRLNEAIDTDTEPRT